MKDSQKPQAASAVITPTCKLFKGLAGLAMSLVFAVTPLAAGDLRISDEHPRIWVQPGDREEILEKISNNQWAQEYYDQLLASADAFVSRHAENTHEFLLELPLNWDDVQDGFPALHYTDSRRAATERQTLTRYLQFSIHCGIVYYLTGDESYARVAADVLGVLASAVARMEPDPSTFNGGVIIPNNHLLEARIYGAQIPVIYDFVKPYLDEHEDVHDIMTEGTRPFPFDDAMTVFRTYIDRAINVGLVDNNWPVLESVSLVHNLLALSDPDEIEHYLPYYLNVDTDHQTSLKTIAEFYEKPGDIFPESLQYSQSVSTFSSYLMLVLDRTAPELNLGSKHTDLLESIGREYLLKFPNGEYISFGDGPRRRPLPFNAHQYAYQLALLNDNDALAERLGGLLNRAIDEGAFVRSELPSPYFSPYPYLLPLRLLWGLDSFKGDPEPPVPPRTDHLPFAGIFIQRNLETEDAVGNGLMGFVGGAHYVHGHASGIDMELYGLGHTLGVNAGRGTYRTEIHENYYRLFAAHNTVIANGASATDGGWVELGIETTQMVSMEPMPRAEAVSPDFSFSTVAFNDAHNLVAPAEQQRTFAVIRTSPTTGYYVDVFRSRSDYENQFHDYLYHNVGDQLDFINLPDGFALKPDPERFQASSQLPWRQNNTFRHPGWHYFESVESSAEISCSPDALFTAYDLEEDPVHMRVHINDNAHRTYSRVLAPPTTMVKSPYNDRKTPTMVVRQQGDAWDNPFAMVFEPVRGSIDESSVTSVDVLRSDDNFAGMIVESYVNGKVQRQIILILDEGISTYENPELDLSFEGHFGIISLNESGDPKSMYIGSGQSLRYREQTLTSTKGSGAFWQAKH